MAYSIGIFGATGAVGKEIIKVIRKRGFRFDELRLYASSRSAGKKVDTELGEYVIENSDDADFSELDLAFFAISGKWSRKNAIKATDAGCDVIDNSSAFRYDDDVPLIVPEVNPHAIRKTDKKGLLIANPNCTTAIAALPLHIICKNYGIRKVIMSTYQATSGAGAAGMEELRDETRKYLAGERADNKVFAHPIAFNIIPHIDSFQENLYTREEMKVVWETRKIFEKDDIPISCTCVRIPTMRVHAESITVETEKIVDINELRKLLSDADGIELRDDPADNQYPMPVTATEKFDVEVGRIRKSLVFEKGIDFFVCGDQLLKGAALNAVQIAELLNKEQTD